MPSPPPGAMVTLAVADELREQLLAQERELDSRKCTIATWDYGLVASECALGRTCMERDTVCAQAEATWQDYYARLRASTSSSKHSINFNQMMEEHQILLSLQEIDLEVHEEKLAEE
jgi:flavoprotein